MPVLPRQMLPLVGLPLLLAATGSAQSARVEAVRFWSFGDVTRIAIQTQGEYKLFSDQIQNPSRVYFDLAGLRPPGSMRHGVQSILVNDKRVKEIRIAEVSPGRTRIVFDLEGPADVVSSQLVNPDRLMIEIRPKDTSLKAATLERGRMGSQTVDLAAAGRAAKAGAEASTPPLHDLVPDTNSGPSQPVRPESLGESPGPATSEPPPSATTSRVTAPPLSATTPESPALSQLTVSATSASSLASNPEVAVHETPAAASSVRAAGKNAAAKIAPAGDPSLVRIFGLKLGRVVIDAGHGGHDTGTIGPNGLMEKDLVLDVALRLGKLIVQRMGAEVVYTRSGDVFIPLEERTKIANQEKADLFISIHANSSPEPAATGVETYYFNLTSDRRGLDLAMRENATASSSISDLNELLHKAVLETKMEESRQFAQQVQTTLWTASAKMNVHSRNRGVRQAPFVVLIGAMMPSILAEIGFVSNPHDARLLKRNDQRQKIAEALYKGIAQYASTLSHNQIARAGS